MVVPSKITTFPDGLADPNLEYSGFFDDGWLTSSSSITLNQSEKANALLFRGMVPGIGNNAFSTQLQVYVDQQFVGGKILGVGNFDLTFPVPSGTGHRKIQFYFSDAQSLGNGDNRQVSSLIKLISLEEVPGLSPELPRDIAQRGISFGAGWYLPETVDKQSYRWVNNKAEITVTMPDEDASAAVHLELEPGPGLDSKPFELLVANVANNVVTRRKIEGRETIRLSLPLAPGQTETFRLQVEGGGKQTPNDSRILNFRVFGAKFGQHTPDVTRLGGGITLGAGWYDPEFGNGRPFRWVGNNAELTVTMPEDKTAPLTMELEPGPGVDFKPFELQVRSAAGQPIAKVPITSRETARIPLPTAAGKTESFKLFLMNGGKQIANESRILNFRVFSVGLGNLRKDIVPSESFAGATGQVEIGAGWYAPETRGKQTYRWVNNNAELIVSMPPKGSPVLNLEIEPGPGLEQKPFTLQFLNSAGSTLTQTTVNGHGTINVPLPLAPGQKETLKLHVDGGGKPVPQDNRTLNFRVFKIRLGKPITNTRSNLLQAGIYEDGWAIKSVTFQLPQLKNPATLTVKGVVPLLSDKTFSTPFQVYVDGQEVVNKILTLGDFDIQASPPAGAGNRQIELRFGRSQRLPGEDKRAVSALLKYVGFDVPFASETRTELTTEIPFPANSISLGDGWYPAETFQGLTFRWVSNNAEMTLNPPNDNRVIDGLSFTAETGPGVSSQPFELRLVGAEQQVIATATVRGNEKIRFNLLTPITSKTLLRLVVEGGGKPIPGDLRILNLRIFKIEIE